MRTEILTPGGAKNRGGGEAKMQILTGTTAPHRSEEVHSFLKKNCLNKYIKKNESENLDRQF